MCEWYSDGEGMGQMRKGHDIRAEVIDFLLTGCSGIGGDMVEGGEDCCGRLPVVW